MTGSLELAAEVVDRAHHPLLLAIPAFVPAIVVVGVVVYVARKDRLDERREQELLERGLDEIPDDLKNIDDEQGDR
ncbi:MAG: hypothetical protein P1U38_05485 [Aeromicrobium sp.]|uniref:hypothetical protein n=1 Tax=Aeromicrobium sp. TaxID=1871063 RepID=UPI0025C54337|nr:hypothetical protein [Aeromicrobium sp.]MCK5892134.1 hypothetical protein [Aeromicrobium sp.]MDF1704208.1 hypothetical protein [Aeromicrobium sp.]